MSFETICAEVGRDPASVERSVGVSVNPTRPADWRPSVLSGTPREIADGLLAFRDAGITRAELMFGPGTLDAVDALGEALTLLRAA